MSEPAALPLDLLARRLGAHAQLDADDLGGLCGLRGTVRTLRAAAYILREGEPQRHCAILLAGFAFRQKLTGDGARQIVALHIPGDPLDFQTLYLDRADHNVQALGRAEVLLVPRTDVQALLESRPAVARAVVMNLLIEASMAREWLLNTGRRGARARVAHLLCEFAVRMDAQGLGGPDSYELPMTQEELGDALGLTAVHVNRTLKRLEVDGALRRRGRRIVFTDWHAMARIGDFSDRYLHLPDRKAAT